MIPGVVRAQWGLLLVAVQVLTRLPVPAPYEPGALRRAVRYFPVVGAGVGLLAGLVYVAAAAGLPGWVAACLSLAATLLLTGALHEDGLADSCDGLLSGRPAEKALVIMRDSRIGAFGTLGLLAVVGAKLGAVAALPGASVVAAMVAAHALSRAWTVGVAAALPYAQADGMAAGVAAPAMRDVAIALGFGVLTLLPLGGRAAAALALSGFMALGLALYARRRIGGYTGDVLGAVQQVTELAVLLAVLWRVG